MTTPVDDTCWLLRAIAGTDAAYPARVPPINPASRLHQVLSVADKSRSNGSAIDAWAGVFNVDSATPRFLARAAELTALVATVRQLVENLPDTENPELILRNYKQVETIAGNFVRVAGRNMTQFMQPLDDRGLMSVEMADHALRRAGYRESRLEQSKLDELQREVHDLIADIGGTEGLSVEQKRSIVAHLRAVEDALTSAFLGDQDLMRANDGLVGSILTLPRQVLDNQVVRQAAKFAAAVTTAVTVNFATQAAEDMIEPPKPPSVVVLEWVIHGDAPAITSSQLHSDVVDAEIVEDEHWAPVETQRHILEPEQPAL